MTTACRSRLVSTAHDQLLVRRTSACARGRSKALYRLIEQWLTSSSTLWGPLVFLLLPSCFSLSKFSLYFIIIILGDITIMRNQVTFDSDTLTLTCISTGGPATTVTWTRDSTTTVTEGTETVLDDPETAQYTHTLTVTTGGEYTCTVENNKPSSDSATITLTGTYM